MMIASGFIGKLKPKFFLPSRKKAAGGLYLGSYFTTTALTAISSSLLKSGIIMSPRSMINGFYYTLYLSVSIEAALPLDQLADRVWLNILKVSKALHFRLANNGNN
jgi:hypothetical protein